MCVCACVYVCGHRHTRKCNQFFFNGKQTNKVKILLQRGQTAIVTLSTLQSPFDKHIAHFDENG